LLGGLSEAELRTMAKALELTTYSKGEYIIKEGDSTGDKFFIIKEGEVNVTNLNTSISSRTSRIEV
jgi:CRP-like cAMP-binding protein